MAVPPTDPIPASRTGQPPGWDDRWQQDWEARDPAIPGRSAMRVVRIDKGGITVSDRPGDERLVVAAKPVRRVVVGDVCTLDDEAGRIEEILARRTVFERRAPGSGRDEVTVETRALAANMDVVLVLQPLDAGVNTARLARELVLAWESGARAVVVLTKADLVEPSVVAQQRAAAERFAPGAPVVCVSSRGAPGLGELEPLLGTGTLAALLGASGSGKSTLANALAGHEVQLTAEVRSGDRRGRHTTTAGQMIELSGDRWLIDTPGIRSVGLWHADEGLERAFADLTPFAQECRFADCSHASEPGCALVAAVQAGHVGADRLETWHLLLDEVEAVEAEAELRGRELERAENQRARRRAGRRGTEPDGDT